ncbi:hypothetical protein C2S51_019957 [Perilla frutescens var. frutescens]|nr:hypothetical protein C2S51_019957 [Perilla frutescens var. frutescens]
MADSSGDLAVENPPFVVSSDEDEIHGAKKLSKKTPTSRSSKKSHASGLRRPPLTSIGNRELRDLSKFAKGTLKVDLLKEKTRVKKKNKKEVRRSDGRSSHVDNEGDKEASSDFTSDSEVFEKDNICYDAKPLQVVEAGALMEKSFFEGSEQSVHLEESLMADIGRGRRSGSGEVNADVSDVIQSREDAISNFSRKNVEVSVEERLKVEDRVISKLQETEYDDVDLQKEKEDDRRLSEMEFNRFLSEESAGIEFPDRSRVSEYEQPGNLNGEGSVTGNDCRNNMQKPIRGDRAFKDSDFAFDRETGRDDTLGSVNPSTFIESPMSATDMEISMLDGKRNHDPLKSGAVFDLPFQTKAAPLPFVIENPSFQNPKCLNPIHEPAEPSLSPRQTQATPFTSSSPSACLTENPAPISLISTQQLSHSASLPNLNQP